MTQLSANVDAVDLMQNTTITVRMKRVKELRFRIWVAKRLVFLAALFLNCNIDFGMEDA